MTPTSSAKTSVVQPTDDARHSPSSVLMLSGSVLLGTIKQFSATPYLLALCFLIYSLGFFFDGGARKVSSTVSGVLFLCICLFIILLHLRTTCTKKPFKILPNFPRASFFAIMTLIVVSSLVVSVFAVRDYANPLALGLAVMLMLIAFSFCALISLRYIGEWFFVVIALTISDVLSWITRLTNETSKPALTIFTLIATLCFGWVFYRINSSNLLRRPNYSKAFAPLTEMTLKSVSWMRFSGSHTRMSESDVTFGLITGLYNDSAPVKLIKLVLLYCCTGLTFFTHGLAFGHSVFNINFSAVFLIFTVPIAFSVMALGCLEKVRPLWMLSVGSRDHLWSTLLHKVTKLFLYGLLMLTVNTGLVSLLWKFTIQSTLSLYVGLLIAMAWTAYVLCFLSLFPKTINAFTRVLTLIFFTGVLSIGIVALIHEKWMIAAIVFVCLGAVSMIHMHRKIRHYVLYGDLHRSRLTNEPQARPV